MRLVRKAEIDEVGRVYDEAIVYAHGIGGIDWDYPFPRAKLKEFIGSGVLWSFGGPEELTAIGTATIEPDLRIWNNETGALYVGRLAVCEKNRELGVFSNTILPELVGHAHNQSLSEIRLDVLAENRRLQSFYERNGFMNCGQIAITSSLSGQKIDLVKMQKLIN